MKPVKSNSKKILLVDLDDLRRQSRVRLLNMAGYEVEVRDDAIAAERLDHEGAFDLIIIALHGHPEKAIEYSDHLAVAQPLLPILLLTDWGVYVPPGTLSETIETGNPGHLIQEIALRLAGSTHVRELPILVG
jgi:DNA-binding NarL/FixJ family response regulator